MAKDDERDDALTQAAGLLVRQACVGLALDLRWQYLDRAFPELPWGTFNQGPRPARRTHRGYLPQGAAHLYGGEVEIQLPAQCTRLPSYEDGWLYKGPDDVVCGRMSVRMGAHAKMALDLAWPQRPQITGGFARIWVNGFADAGLCWERELGDGHELAMRNTQLWLERWARLQQRAQRAWKTGPALMTIHDPADGTVREQPPHGRLSDRGGPRWNNYYAECYDEMFPARGGWHVPDPAAFVTRAELRAEFEMERD